MITMSKADLYDALSEAIDAARQDAERSTEDIVEKLADRFADVPEPQSDWTGRAARHFEHAAASAGEMGEHESVPVVQALVGVGCALMSIREDAEVFYAMMGERKRQEVTP